MRARNERAPAWVGITYLIYAMMVWGLCVGGAGYAVFELGRPGWWFVAGLMIGGCGYSPAKWHGLWTGIEAKAEIEP